MKIFSVLLLLGCMTGCLPKMNKSELVFSESKFTQNQETEALLANEQVTYEDLKKAVLVPYCVSCHKGFMDEKKLLKQVEAGNPDESELFISVRDGTMPEEGPALSSTELEIVRRYIEGLK
jgi:hypothetical protein